MKLSLQRSVCVSSRLVAGVVCLVVSLVVLAAPCGASAASPGVNLTSISPQQIAAEKALGSHWVRMFLHWDVIEPGPGGISAPVAEAYEHGFEAMPAGTKVILDIVGSPAWETGSGDEALGPANPEDYASLVATLAKRFAPWVKAYEIWNEEDSNGWWVNSNPVAYTALLKTVYPAIKSADPSAVVILGGLTGNDYQFLEGVYKAGGKGYFNAVSVHTDTACNLRSPYEFVREPDGLLIPDAFLAYKEIHAVMVTNGDSSPIWMTEMSWRTTSATCTEGLFAGQKAGGVSEVQQATFLREAYHCLSKAPYVQLALWYPLMDEGIVTSGLLHEDGTRKPSFAAMREYVRRGDRLHEGCGNFSGPKISIHSPANHVHYSGPLPIRVSARAGQGVFRIRLEIDGKLIRNYDGPTFPTVLYGSLNWQGAKHIAYGRHKLTFIAYTKEMNVSERSITIVHVRPRHGHH